MNLEKEVFDIAITDILPNRFQPREIFDEASINELAQSIKEHGVIQPIIVRKIGDKYEIVAGERRFRASQVAGLTKVPALIRNIDDKESAKVALLENLQRKNLNAIEEAKTYQTIIKLDNLTQEELANTLGKSQSAIANKLRLLNLDEEVQNALLNAQISERHARSLLNVTDKEKQKELLEKIVLNRMTVKQLDEEIAIITGKNVMEQEVKEELSETVTTPNQIIEENFDFNVNAMPNPNDVETNNNETIEPLQNQVENNMNEDMLKAFVNQYSNLNFDEIDEKETIEPVLVPNESNVLEDSFDIDNLILPSIDEHVIEEISPIEELNIEIDNDIQDEPIDVKNEEVLTNINNAENNVELNIPDITNQYESNLINQEGQELIEVPVVDNQVENNTWYEAQQQFEMPNIDIPLENNDTQEITQEPFNNNLNMTNTNTISQDMENLEEKQEPVLSTSFERPLDVYDLRFAINNFRQAVQNTEKFGFNVDVEEFDFDNVYQIVIKIDKNKQ